ncbi:hypothetical protein A6V36_16275 [Paraburkholderia ginsengiterrae]|uniref:Serine/threonine protein kinase n=1 Tax=Paraburkholderia ginsengiterrae TaxID=1462993 RepID=A0A1A9NC94_9BURK|nr:hypothetical protein [Paraburkholderia ginsengiterrae]OAJ51578.1 hypothetical protein A6V36_16275 [Paraburkholderia ginsengiterrae]OAJ64592.1 hypothetical protein A6V37_19215 [Paraburkholderia ginsengiterrae]
MKSRLLVLSTLSLALAACGGGGGSSGSTSATQVNGATNPTGSSTSGNGATGSTGNGNAALNVTPSTTSALSCTSPATSAGSGSATISADTPSTDGTRIFAQGTTFQLSFTTNVANADTLNWAVTDTLGHVAASGSTPVAAGSKTTTFNCTSTLAGYFAATGTLAQNGGQLPQAGTRPAGIATFGVMPNLAGVIPAVTYARQEQHRFGMQGANDNGPLLAALGISSTIDDRELSTMEPNGPNTFNPSANNLDPFYTSGNVMRLIRLDGIPAWASSTGAFQDDTTLPTDLAYYQNYMSRVGTESNAIRAAYFPTQSANYYQVTWEPNQMWTDTDANFIALYKAVYQGIHSTDPHAMVMGPADAFPSLTTTRLKRLAPLGFGQYIDAVATHGYYDAGTSPSHPPERYDSDPSTAEGSLRGQMRDLRAEMANDYRPGMHLFSTEAGISYDLGSSYGPNYPSANVLYAQAAVAARMHIITLGEGADQTYVFYGADYPGEVGYGTFFDLNDAQGAFGASNLSPKPVAMAISAMTHTLDGTTTLGPVNGTPTGIYAYAFQQVGNGAVITALWAHNNNVWSASTGFSSTYSVAYSLTVDAPGTSGTVKLIDMMGNATSASYSNGVLTLNLTESPVYVVSGNASVAKANATTPVGYVGM